MARAVAGRRVAGRIPALSLGLAIASAACATPIATPPLGTAEPATTSIPIIIDADFEVKS